MTLENEREMQVEMRATGKDHCRRPFRLFPDARTGFRGFLQALFTGQKGSVLLPAYVGWSHREGSGVFDPIRELRVPYAFYRVDAGLRIDLQHLEDVLKKRRTKITVLIHYFGFVDPGYREAVALGRRYGTYILEDEAHAMLTDLVGCASGRLGDACIFSLHKMLAVKRGGMLLVDPAHEGLLRGIEGGEPDCVLPWEYDLPEIARRRRKNAKLLSRLLRSLEGVVDPLWGDLADGVIPQTYPVIIRRRSRDQLYFLMNQAGYGVVSLYHTLIGEIDRREFPASHDLSRLILNLPVHQDAEPERLERMIALLAESLDPSPRTRKRVHNP